MRVWEMMMIEKYNQRVKSGFLSQAREEMLKDVFERYINISYQLWKNVRENVKESQKNQLLKRN